jgi:prepilin peptidase CpaA
MDQFLTVILISALIACAITDSRRQRIPNWVTLPLIVLGIALHSVGSGWAGCLLALKGCGLGFLLFFIPYFLGGMGAGDVKLMSAVGTVIGPDGILHAFLYIAIIGGVFALLSIIRRQGLRIFITQHFRSIRDFLSTGYYASNSDTTIANKRARFGYGIPMALGTCAYLLQTHYGIFVP